MFQHHKKNDLLIIKDEEIMLDEQEELPSNVKGSLSKRETQSEISLDIETETPKPVSSAPSDVLC